ncbi:MAG: DUF928 domain-containing protein [Cyanobacteria bacterium P01_H01_bin.15]
METGVQYNWTLAVYCDPTRPASAVAVRGTLERIRLDSQLSSALSQANDPQTKAVLYAEAGIWHEALTELGEWYRVEPSAAGLWVDLLTQGQLADLADKLLVSCCQTELD